MEFAHTRRSASSGELQLKLDGLQLEFPGVKRSYRLIGHPVIQTRALGRVLDRTTFAQNEASCWESGG